MKYKLIDVRNEQEDGVTFGTCELCMHVGTHYYEVYVLKDENGQEHSLESGFWSWGDYMTYSYESIHNAIDFADWLSKQNLPEDINEEYFFHNVYDRYVEEVQEDEEE